MHGVSIKSIKRAGVNIPVLAATKINPGDMLELVGTKMGGKCCGCDFGVC